MINKELLSEVLHGSRIIIKDLVNMENCLEYVSYCSINEMNGTKHNENLPDNYYVVKADRWQEINIYELAHKCKEWALSKGYIVIEYPLCVHIYKENTVIKKVEDKLSQCFIVDRVFQACEWILENR